VEHRQGLYRLEGAALYEIQAWLHPFERFWREKLTGLSGLLDSPEDDA
jgi:hypothetical protein